MNWLPVFRVLVKNFAAAFFLFLPPSPEASLSRGVHINALSRQSVCFQRARDRILFFLGGGDIILLKLIIKIIRRLSVFFIFQLYFVDSLSDFIFCKGEAGSSHAQSQIRFQFALSVRIFLRFLKSLSFIQLKSYGESQAI